MTQLTELTEYRIDTVYAAYDLLTAGGRVWVEPHELTEIIGWDTGTTFNVMQILIGCAEFDVYYATNRRPFYAHVSKTVQVANNG